MPMKVRQHGSTDKTMKLLDKVAHSVNKAAILNKYGKLGVEYLSEATPKRTGLTASSWYYKIDDSEAGVTKLIFSNSNVVKGVPIAVILQYGHGTRNGGYVQGIDYINPASAKLFEQMAKELWAEVVTP